MACDSKTDATLLTLTFIEWLQNGYNPLYNRRKNVAQIPHTLHPLISSHSHSTH